MLSVNKRSLENQPARTPALLTCLLLVLCFACSPAKTSSPTATTREIIDDEGHHLSLPATVDRVVSLAPNLTEIVFAVGGGKTLVGDTTYCDYPAEAKSIEKVGDTANPSIERIIALRPQIVLVSTSSQLEVFTQQLKGHDIQVFVTDPRDLEGVFRSMTKIGEIVGTTNEANALVAQLRQRVNLVETAVKGKPKLRIFYQLSAEPLYTAGHDSFVNDLFNRAGAESVTANVPGAWPRYSAESALAAKLEAIILPTGGSMGAANSSVVEALRNSPAVKAGKVYKINDDHLNRPGPRLVDGLEEMAKALHPDAFK
ncbi:MAG TPA: cobalamin-binding protein [Pyrinomonadaceae bacterium]